MNSFYYVHDRLRLIHGLPAIAGDTNTNESIKKTVDLLSPGGFNLATDVGAWVPRNGALAGGGNYLQLGGAQGEILQESNYERVTETFTLTVNVGNPLDRIRLENDLLYMKHYAESFWAQDGNLDPVYLEWGVQGQTGIGNAPIYQYAHIYSLDFAWSNSVPQTVTLTVVRRPDWLPIPPGANPQYWTKYALSQTLTTSNSQLDVTAGANNHRFNGYVHMNTTWSVSSFIYTGYIDIPGTSIPGNLPALATIAARMDVGGDPDVMMVSRYTKPTVWRSGGVNYAPLHTLEAVQMTLVLDATSVAETNSISGNAVSVSFATATLARRLELNVAKIAANQSSLIPGKYIVLARVKPQAITSTFTLQFRLRLQGGGGEYYAIGDQVNVPAWDGVSSFEWNVINLGEFTIPSWTTASDGTGLEPNGIIAELYASRSGGASALRISDLTFMPTDEVSTVAIGADTLDTNTSYIIDGTSYGTHGYPDDVGHSATGSAFTENLALQGNMITLQPGVNNRLYFYVYNRGVYQYNSVRGYTTRSASVKRLEVGVNIVPRWLGLRDT